jgi:hypothetical protein
MKKKQLVMLLIVLLPATLCSVRSNAADPVSDRQPRTEEAIETIRNRYAQVNRDLHMLFFCFKWQQDMATIAIYEKRDPALAAVPGNGF